MNKKTDEIPDWLVALKDMNPMLATKAEKYLEEKGADIRNKLSPIKNYLAIINQCSIDSEHESVLKLVKMEHNNVKKSVEYLSNVL